MKKSFKMTTREMVEIAFLIALAVVLDLAGIKIGHASFTMVPLFVLAYRHGFVKSLIVIAFIYYCLNQVWHSCVYCFSCQIFYVCAIRLSIEVW